jgi:hypothetical protein
MWRFRLWRRAEATPAKRSTKAPSAADGAVNRHRQRDWAQQQRPLAERSVGKAITNMLGLWPRATRFLVPYFLPSCSM